jgi:F-type H+-transporting ATPase subunit epsilon
MAEPFQLDLVSPERLLMSEKVDQVVVTGTEGQFTVLSGHAPVMTTIRPSVLRVTYGGKEDRIFVLGGFADVNAEGLTILAEHATPMSEVKADTLTKEIKAAEEAVSEANDETARADAAMKVESLREVEAELGRA